MGPRLFVEFTQGVQGTTTHGVWLIPKRPLIVRVAALGLTDQELKDSHVTITVTSATTSTLLASCETPGPKGSMQESPLEHLYMINRATQGTAADQLSVARLDPNRTFNFLLDSATCSQGALIVQVTCDNFGGQTLTDQQTITFLRSPLTMPITVVRCEIPGMKIPSKKEVEAQLSLLPLLFPIVNVALTDVRQEADPSWTGQPTFAELLGNMSELWNASTGLVLAAVSREWTGGQVGAKLMSMNGTEVASAYTTRGGVTLAAHELAHQLGLPHSEDSQFLDSEGRLEQTGNPPTTDVVGCYLSHGAPLQLVIPQPSDTRDYMFSGLMDASVPKRPDAGRWASVWSHDAVYRALESTSQGRVVEQTQSLGILTFRFEKGALSLGNAYVVSMGDSAMVGPQARDGSSTIMMFGKDDQPISPAVPFPDIWDKNRISTKLPAISIAAPLYFDDAVIRRAVITRADGTSLELEVPDAGGAAPDQVEVTYESPSGEHSLSATVTWSTAPAGRRILVRFTPDDGRTWVAIASREFAEALLTVDISDCLRPTGSKGRFEVSAGNGTRPAISRTVDLDPSPNRMVIVTPPNVEGVTPEVNAGETMLASGAMFGPRATEAEPHEFHWSIEEGGGATRDLGTGREILVRAADLSPGKNTLILAGPDPDILARRDITLTGVA